MVFPGDGVHTPTGSRSTSQPQPQQDIEAIEWESPQKGQINRLDD
jgi:hypothetical protein